MFSWNRFSISKKFSCILVLIALVVSIPLLAFISYRMEVFAQDQLELQVKQTARVVEGNFDVIIDTSLRFFENSLTTFYGDLQSNSYALGEPVRVKDVVVPELHYNGVALSQQTDVVDNFSILTGGVATIFVRSGNDFVRISTSLTNEKGERAFATSLGTNHPAYAEMMKPNPKTFRGKVRLFGRDYLSTYKPVFNEQKQVVGILFIAYNLEETHRLMVGNLENIRVGEHGKVVIIDQTNNQFIFGKEGKPSDYPY
ncbi:MAG: Cache 3/Cache 2 fusion domain-containing protein, partial [Helicobacter sp.]|nr:Cache 3/Cache 2 fusion domain-containing protein [Helicobacter sp.]